MSVPMYFLNIALALFITIPLTTRPQVAEITLQLTKIQGTGPQGMQYLGGFGEKSGFPEEIQKALPEVSGLPENLSDVKEYHYIFNGLQFYYQSYKAGKISRAAFLQLAETKHWELADTAGLSPIPLKSGIVVIAGRNEYGEAVYLADVNQNADFSDDVVKPLLNAFEARHTSIPVSVEYQASDTIIQEELLMSIGLQSAGDNFMLTTSFPEFRYSKFTFNDQTYVLCTGSYAFSKPTIAVFPDRPYFEALGRDKMVEIGEFVDLDGYLFTFSGYRDNGREITLSGEFAANIILGDAQRQSDRPSVPLLPTVRSSESIVSTQVGFKAPEISGLDIISNSLLTLSGLKGKWVYVDFWSTNCGPCIAEFPHLKEIYNRLDTSKVAFIGVAEEYKEGGVKRLLAQHESPWPTILTAQPETVTAGYDIYSYPTTFLIDPNGVIQYKGIRANELEGRLQALLND